MIGTHVKRQRRIALSGLVVLAAALPAGLLRAQDRGLQPVELAEKRALLIGNAKYAHASDLVNTIPDVRELERVLRDVGFDAVTRKEDLSMLDMVNALDEFAGELGPGDLALFYFSGHGLQVERENYLLPVDYERKAASEMPYTTLAANRVRARLEGTGAEVRVLVLDACRNNPFGEGRSTAGGLAKMEAKAKGTLIAYSAGPGQVASDNPGGALGLYMTHLVPELRKSSIDLETAFENAQGRVLDASKGKQFPALEDSIVGKVYLRGQPDTVPPPALPGGDCERYWAEVRESGDPKEFEWYLGQCPDGAHRGLAEARLARLRQSSVQPSPDEGPKVTGAPSGGRASRAGEVREFDGMEFVWIPPGTFEMGSRSELARDEEQPVTRVRISEGFWLGRYEVTQGEWEAVMGSNPSTFPQCGSDCPVESVSWEDAQEFIRRLNGLGVGSGLRYRLPTEAEWEYSARAGSRTDTYAGGMRSGGEFSAPVLDGIAWYGTNSQVSFEPQTHNCPSWNEARSGGVWATCGPHPVGGKSANAWGLHDMLGNVSEWVQDWYGKYPGGFVEDPTGPSGGSPGRVTRGCNWHEAAFRCRSSSRDYIVPNDPLGYLRGFRLLRTE